MRGKDLYEKITDIDPDIISENCTVGKGKRPTYIKFLVAAACLAIILSAAFLWRGDKAEGSPALPILTLNPALNEGMGFEGYMAWSIADLTNSNPWNEDMDLTHLPVIENKLTYNQMHRVENANFNLMQTLLTQAAQSLDMDVENLLITNDAPDEDTKKFLTEKFAMTGEEVPEGYFDMSRLFIEDERYKVEVDTSYTVRVDFKTPIQLPDEYNFTHHATYADTYAVAEYLKEEYSDFIGMENPMIDISGGDFNIYAEQSYGLAFYEEGDDDVQNLLNYHFNTVQFYCNGDGALFLARKYNTDLREIVGEYPIINTQEALELLQSGNYITTVPQALENTAYVKKVELIYRTGTMEKQYMPYYKFYVELPDMKRDNGLNTYGAYYVPAIESRYIENMPVWDGRFN